MAKKLMGLLKVERHLSSSEGDPLHEEPIEAVEQFKKEVKAVNTLEKMDFKTEYQPRKEVRNEGVLLATNIELLNDDVQYLNIKCIEGMMVCINLNQALIIAVCNMLQLSSKAANWGIGSKLSSKITLELERPKILH